MFEWAPIGMAFAIIGAIVVIGPIVAVPVMLYVSLKGMAGAERTFQPAAPQDFPEDYRIATQTGQWAAARGFTYLGCYSMKMPNTVFIAAWQLGGVSTFFCMYGVRNRYGYDFITYLTPNRTLTTTNTRDGLLLPNRPGRYEQAFENTDFDTLWRRHQESLAYLQTTGNITPGPMTMTFQESFTGDLVGQLRYVRSIPFWPIRGLKWYFINRARLVNKSIEEQHRARLILLPTDVEWREELVP